MNRSFKLFAVSILCLVLMASCTDDDPVNEQGNLHFVSEIISGEGYNLSFTYNNRTRLLETSGNRIDFTGLGYINDINNYRTTYEWSTEGVVDGKSVLKVSRYGEDNKLIDYKVISGYENLRPTLVENYNADGVLQDRVGLTWQNVNPDSTAKPCLRIVKSLRFKTTGTVSGGEIDYVYDAAGNMLGYDQELLNENGYKITISTTHSYTTRSGMMPENFPVEFIVAEELYPLLTTNEILEIKRVTKHDFGMSVPDKYESSVLQNIYTDNSLVEEQKISAYLANNVTRKYSLIYKYASYNF